MKPATPSIAAAKPLYKIEFDSVRAPPPVATAAPALAPTLVKVTEKPTAVSLQKAQGPSVAVALSDAPVIQRGELLISASQEPPKAVAATREGASAFQLPLQARFVDEAGELRTTEIVTELAGTGLRVIGNATSFVAELFVKVQDKANPSSSNDLPKSIDVLVTGLDSIAPQLLKFGRLGEWQKVALGTASPVEPVTIKLSSSDNVHADLPIKVLRPVTILTLSPASIQGFGVETADLTVRVEGVPSPEGRVVVLQSSQGRLGALRVTLDKDGIGSTSLRSEGHGLSTLGATSPPLQAAAALTIPFAFPVAFLVCALLGGALGGAVRYFARRADGEKPWIIAVGLLVGLLASALGVLGLNYTSFNVGPLTSEIAVLVVAAGGALLGPSALLLFADKGSKSTAAASS
jgi:hypothetical protein